MSVKVKLEDGSEEKYHKGYIIESLETIGLDHATAKKIANEVEKHRGISEHEIKVKIFRILDSIDCNLADQYMRTKKVRVRSETMEIKGNALLPEFLMEYLGLRNGDEIDIIHGNSSSIIRAYGMTDTYHHQDHNSILMSHNDMKNIGVREQHQVAICKHFSN